jgi:tRNA threonylcarbamoyladenosine biosynthesis protein TsaE
VAAIELHARSPEETEAVGEALGRAARGSELIGLVGDLGAGKTSLVRGVARGLGIDPARVYSPSFIMVTNYPGGRLPLVHVDLYRLDPPVEDTGLLREALHGDGVAAVEWFDRLRPDPGEEAVVVTLAFAPGDGRVIRVDARGARHETFVARAVRVMELTTSRA